MLIFHPIVFVESASCLSINEQGKKDKREEQRKGEESLCFWSLLSACLLILIISSTSPNRLFGEMIPSEAESTTDTWMGMKK